MVVPKACIIVAPKEELFIRRMKDRLLVVSVGVNVPPDTRCSTSRGRSDRYGPLSFRLDLFTMVWSMNACRQRGRNVRECKALTRGEWSRGGAYASGVDPLT